MTLSNSISNIFGVSPIKPIQNHMAEVISCVTKLEEFLNATFDDDWVKAAEVFDLISADEQSADELKKEFRMHMPKSLFMPVSRGDLLSIITQQDNIANLTKDICGIILGRQMAIPKALHADFIGFVGSSTVTCEKAHGAINELDEQLKNNENGSLREIVHDLMGLSGLYGMTELRGLVLAFIADYGSLDAEKNLMRVKQIRQHIEDFLSI